MFSFFAVTLSPPCICPVPEVLELEGRGLSGGIKINLSLTCSFETPTAACGDTILPLLSVNYDHDFENCSDITAVTSFRICLWFWKLQEKLKIGLEVLFTCTMSCHVFFFKGEEWEAWTGKLNHCLSNIFKSAMRKCATCSSVHDVVRFPDPLVSWRTWLCMMSRVGGLDGMKVLDKEKLTIVNLWMRNLVHEKGTIELFDYETKRCYSW